MKPGCHIGHFRPAEVSEDDAVASRRGKSGGRSRHAHGPVGVGILHDAGGVGRKGFETLVSRLKGRCPHRSASFETIVARWRRERSNVGTIVAVDATFHNGRAGVGRAEVRRAGVHRLDVADPLARPVARYRGAGLLRGLHARWRALWSVVCFS